jgi:patatin-related protein
MTEPDDANPGPLEAVRELRLAVVCYGGVSLAIYLHGVTKELHKLVVASAAFEADPDRNPFDRGRTTERVYWELLKELSERGGVRTRVVVDVISGTSAGGINGVFLAKALAHDLSQDALRDLWFAQGDIARLLRGWQRLPVKLRYLLVGLPILLAPWRAVPPLATSGPCP